MKDFKVSIIIPVFNEENTILPILERIKEAPFDKEIIIVDDGSTDCTKSIIYKWRSSNNIKFISYKKNRGKGFAVREGFKHATGDIVIIQDADLEYNPDDYKSLFLKLLEDNTDVVYGTRYKSWKLIFEPGTRKYHILGNKIITTIANIIYGSNLTDIMTCYKAFKNNVVKNMNLKCDGFAIEAEITSEVLKRNFLIKEVSISYKPRSHKHGKKINFFVDFFRVIYWLIKKKIEQNARF
jgi:glycosyltransferase involved in cell wall biosynthesis